MTLTWTGGYCRAGRGGSGSKGRHRDERQDKRQRTDCPGPSSAHLAIVVPGEVADTTELERLLAASWHKFSGDDGGMSGQKLLGRMENVAWAPPKLTFTIERHGGTVRGSTRAELQHWEVNADQQTAAIEKRGQTPCRTRPGRTLYILYGWHHRP
jgi:hypothetical protein